MLVSVLKGLLVILEQPSCKLDSIEIVQVKTADVTGIAQKFCLLCFKENKELWN